MSLSLRNRLVARLPVLPLIRNTGQVNSWAAVASNYPPGTIFPNYADVQISWTPKQLTASWKTDINTSGSMTLPVTQARAASTYVPLSTVTNWAEFKDFVYGLELAKRNRTCTLARTNNRQTTTPPQNGRYLFGRWRGMIGDPPNKQRRTNAL
jgi:hypothetical protein